ncbi:MAG: outer membrane beta-barrel protein [Azospirillum sp.]|nr:outer membrane beta-barrel protein [Azospirillum sp.]
MLRAALGAALILTAVGSAGPATAEEGFKTKAAGQFLVRLRAIGLIPNDGDPIKTEVGDVEVGRTQVSSDTVPEIDFSYFITDNIAVELIAATTQHHVTAKLNGGGEIVMGDVQVLPPTLTAQYHFFTKERVSPYLGAGINYTIMFDEHGANSALSDVRFSNSVGPALQAGVDVAIGGNWSLNFDIKKIWLASDVKATLRPATGLKATADLDPLVVGVGVGYRF